MQYWLIKTEPSTYSWDDLWKAGKAVWDGVNNPQAKNNMKKMKVGDQCFFYHTGDEKAVVGITEIIKAAYPDPKDKTGIVVEIKPVKLTSPVTLSSIKQSNKLAGMVLVKQARLSVQPVTKNEWEEVLAMQ